MIQVTRFTFLFHWLVCWLLQVISPFWICFISLNEVGRLALTFSFKASMEIPQRSLEIIIEREQMSTYQSLTPILNIIQHKLLLLCVYILSLVEVFFREKWTRNMFLSICNHENRFSPWFFLMPVIKSTSNETAFRTCYYC